MNLKRITLLLTYTSHILFIKNVQEKLFQLYAINKPTAYPMPRW